MKVLKRVTLRNAGLLSEPLFCALLTARSLLQSRLISFKCAPSSTGAEFLSSFGFLLLHIIPPLLHTRLSRTITETCHEVYESSDHAAPYHILRLHGQLVG
jgi:hypothetical protein